MSTAARAACGGTIRRIVGSSLRARGAGALLLLTFAVNNFASGAAIQLTLALVRGGQVMIPGMVLTSTRPSPRVLVVDDEESVRLFAERVLGDAGYSVLLASEGSEALEVATERGPFALFILDVVMPQMTGEEVSRRLRLMNPDVKVLYFTGHSDQLFEERRVLWANESFIEKPVSVRALLEAVSFSLYGDTQGLRTS